MAEQNQYRNVFAAKERTRLPEAHRSRQNLPIRPLQTAQKRVYMKEAVDTSCWAYMKLLRESGLGKVYPVDPYAEVYTFRKNVLGILTESADGMGDSWMYLIIGPEKALLIDTSFGIGNLKGLVEELAPGKEVIVVNTHGHYDHGYGNCQFDRVYCHKYEVPSLEAQNGHIWDYLFEEGTGLGIWAEFDRKDIVTWKPYEIIGCEDGHIFDLGGGHEVELIFMGGHTAGHAGYLDKKNRIFFAGDDIISMRVGVGGGKPGLPYGEFASVNTLCENLERLTHRLDEFDHVFPSHFITDLENQAVVDMYETCREAIENPFEGYVYKKGEGENTRYYRHVEGLGTLCYSERAIRQ